MWTRSARAIAIVALAASSVGCPDAAPPPVEEPPVTPPSLPWAERGEPEIAPPVIPWMDGGDDDPVTRPCAPGWTARESAAGMVCDPWPDGGRVHCPGASAMRPSESTCTPIGRACPASGEFADDLPAGTLFVRAGGTGPGTREAPFGTLAEALASAPPGATIALARGAHAGEVTVSAAITLRGACASSTTLSGPLVLDALVAIEDMTITSPASAIVARRGLRARGILVTDHEGHGIDLRGGASVLEDVVVRGGTGSTEALEASVHVINATLEASRVLVEDRRGIALTIDARASASFTDSAFADATPTDEGASALAVVREGATAATFTRTVFENGTNQVLAANGGRIEIEDVLVAGGRPAVGSTVAFGVVVFGELVARGLRTHDIDGFGVAVAAPGTVVVEDTIADGTHASSVGLHAEEGGVITARRARLGPIGIGARAMLGAALELEDARVIEAGQALRAEDIDTRAAFRRVLVRGGRGGARISDQAHAELEDLVLEDIQSDALGDDAIGTYSEATATARRVTASRMGNSCFVALQASSLELADVRCDETLLGAVAAIGGTATLRRAALSRTLFAGISVEEEGTLTAEDVAIRDVGPTERISAGLNVVYGGVLTVTRARVSAVDGYGVSCFAETERLSTVSITDAIVEDATFAGVTVECPTALTRVAILRPGVAGITNSLPIAAIEVSDVRVTEPQPDAVDGRFGHGVHMTNGASLRGARLLVEGARGVGMLATGAGTSVEIASAWISGTRASSCGAGCVSGGSGVVAHDGGRIRLTAFRSFENEVAGVQITSTGTMALMDGWVFGNSIGRNLPPGLDAAPLLDGVQYVMNGAEEDRRELPLPATVLF